jgi:hypothetical protein
LTSVEIEALRTNGHIVNGMKSDTFSIAYIKLIDSKEIKLPHRYADKFFNDILEKDIKHEINKVSVNKRPELCPRILSKYSKTSKKKTQTKKPPPRVHQCTIPLSDVVIFKKLDNPLLNTSKLKCKLPKLSIECVGETKSKKKRSKVDPSIENDTILSKIKNLCGDDCEVSTIKSDDPSYKLIKIKSNQG